MCGETQTLQNSSKLMFEYPGGMEVLLTAKLQKVQDRADVRAESTMTNSVWDALFAVPYQSTDKTDQSEGIDPETDSDELAISVPSRPWVTRPPTYHAAIVSFYIDVTRCYLLCLPGCHGYPTA